jgi:hypothetical protein
MAASQGLGRHPSRRLQAFGTDPLDDARVGRVMRAAVEGRLPGTGEQAALVDCASSGGYGGEADQPLVDVLEVGELLKEAQLLEEGRGGALVGADPEGGEPFVATVDGDAQRVLGGSRHKRHARPPARPFGGFARR